MRADLDSHQQRLGFRDLGHLGRRRKVVEGGREDGMGFGGAFAGANELRQRVRGLELESARSLLARDADGFAVGGFRGDGVALGEDVAPDPMEERIRATTAGLLSEREALRDRRKRVVARAPCLAVGREDPATYIARAVPAARVLPP